MPRTIPFVTIAGKRSLDGEKAAALPCVAGPHPARRGEPMITQVKLVGIPVSDQDRALAFYTQKLGFKVATDQPMGPGQRWIELKIPRAETGVVLFTPAGHEDRVGTQWNGSFACDDVQETYEKLKAAGVE